VPRAEKFGHLQTTSRSRRRSGELTDADGIVATLQDDVLEPLKRLTGQTAVAIELDPAGLSGESAQAFRPAHPVCRARGADASCRDSWAAHLAELRKSPEPHWHRCWRGQRCGVVPVTADGSVVAICQLVCAGTTPLPEFRRHFELLAFLIDNAGTRQPEAPERQASKIRASADCGRSVSAASYAEANDRAWHPKVRGALEVIRRRLREPQLTVAIVAKEMAMNSTYLAHLFHEQIGVRMSRYITERRIELAKSLLLSTNWQIKRIAYESGHRNADWFGQVFRRRTGLTPGEYRQRVRDHGAVGT
jgi:AraC-like DNA-binding protein